MRDFGATADFLTVYIEEAHPNDAWALPDATTENHPSVAQPRTLEERLDVARCFLSTFARNGVQPGPVVVDTFGPTCAGSLYQAWPERLYIVVDGVVAYKSGPGPFGYTLPEVREWLEKRANKA